MQVKILSEHGYEEALRGMAYSYYDNTGDPDEWWTNERYSKAIKRAHLLVGKGAGHDKFLRQIMLWVDINAPRFWWSEFDTYKVGTVAQSTSTMHTLKKGVTEEHFEYQMDEGLLWSFNHGIEACLKGAGGIAAAKSILPEGFLQRRIVTLNYAVLRAIIEQRHDHRLPQWQTFINFINSQCEHPELL